MKHAKRIIEEQIQSRVDTIKSMCLSGDERIDKVRSERIRSMQIEINQLRHVLVVFDLYIKSLPF
jgi:hypothetical protein